MQIDFHGYLSMLSDTGYHPTYSVRGGGGFTPPLGFWAPGTQRAPKMISTETYNDNLTIRKKNGVISPKLGPCGQFEIFTNWPIRAKARFSRISGWTNKNELISVIFFCKWKLRSISMWLKAILGQTFSS